MSDASYIARLEHERDFVEQRAAALHERVGFLEGACEELERERDDAYLERDLAHQARDEADSTLERITANRDYLGRVAVEQRNEALRREGELGHAVAECDGLRLLLLEVRNALHYIAYGDLIEGVQPSIGFARTEAAILVRKLDAAIPVERVAPEPEKPWTCVWSAWPPSPREWGGENLP